MYDMWPRRPVLWALIRLATSAAFIRRPNSILLRILELQMQSRHTVDRNTAKHRLRKYFVLYFFSKKTWSTVSTIVCTRCHYASMSVMVQFLCSFCVDSLTQNIIRFCLSLSEVTHTDRRMTGQI